MGCACSKLPHQFMHRLNLRLERILCPFGGEAYGLVGHRIYSGTIGYSLYGGQFGRPYHNDMRWLLNEEQEQLLFRAIQEFLVNTTKHTQATEVRIHHHFTDTSVILTMQDNGEGTDAINPQMGLTGMEERAKLLGGKVTIQSATNAGFKVRIALPKGGYNDEGNTH